MCDLHLDTHLENEDSSLSALELVRFISMTPAFADYTRKSFSILPPPLLSSPLPLSPPPLPLSPPSLQSLFLIIYFSEYVTSKEGRAAVTKFLQDEQTSAIAGSSSNSSVSKRKREDEEDEEVATPHKLAKVQRIKEMMGRDDGETEDCKLIYFNRQGWLSGTGLMMDHQELRSGSNMTPRSPSSWKRHI
jgi:hypothetical protein